MNKYLYMYNIYKIIKEKIYYITVKIKINIWKYLQLIQIKKYIAYIIIIIYILINIEIFYLYYLKSF